MSLTWKTVKNHFLTFLENLHFLDFAAKTHFLRLFLLQFFRSILPRNLQNVPAQVFHLSATFFVVKQSSKVRSKLSQQALFQVLATCQSSFKAKTFLTRKRLFWSFFWEFKIANILNLLKNIN